MTEDVSTFRLNVLRATYLLILVAMGLQVWPLILRHPVDVEPARGVVRSMLGAVTLLSGVLGLRHPLRMLPLIFWELAWKAIWVLSFGLPLWAAGRLDATATVNMQASLMGVVLFPLVIPWRHVWAQYVRAPGDRWRGRPSGRRALGTVSSTAGE